MYTPTVLTIAGSDTYGGAGIQIDCKTIHALGGYAFSVITALTAQNSRGVKAVSDTSTNLFKVQLESILDDVQVDAVKIGMLANEEIVSTVVAAIDKYKLKNIVLDTVLVSSSGKTLLEASAINMMIKELFPRVDLITPNIPEVNTLLSTNYLGNEDDIPAMASALFDLGANAVLIKGGHSSNQKEAKDYLVSKSLKIDTFISPRVNTTHTHGTGCLLSSAIATHFALGYDPRKSVAKAKNFLYKKLKDSTALNFNYKDEIDERREAIF